MSGLQGFDIIVTPWLESAVYRRARTHRKRRIDKKWKKRYGMVFDHMEVRDPLQMGNRVFMAPTHYRKLLADPRFIHKEPTP